jgi:hypothetical protein
VIVNKDTLVAEAECIVYSINEGNVTIKFKSNEAQVKFPIELFDGQHGLLKFGMHLNYCIKRRANGLKYQFFEAKRTNHKMNSKKREILKLLDKI